MVFAKKFETIVIFSKPCFDFIQEEDREQLSAFLKDLLCTLSLCHASLDSIKAAFSELGYAFRFSLTFYSHIAGISVVFKEFMVNNHNSKKKPKQLNPMYVSQCACFSSFYLILLNHFFLM